MGRDLSVLAIVLSFLLTMVLFQNCGESPKTQFQKNLGSTGNNSDDNLSNDSEEEGTPEDTTPAPTPEPTPAPPVLSSSYIMGTSDDERPYDLMQTSDGGFISGGMVQKTPGDSASQDIMFTKWNSDGTLAYSRLIGGAANDQAFAIEELNDGYLAVGLSHSYQPNGGYLHDEALMVKINKANGSVIWAKKLSAVGRQDIRDIDYIVDAGGNPSLIGVGRTSDDPNGDERALMVKMDLNGNILWQTAIGDDTNNQRFYEVIYVPNQGYFAVGYTTANGDDAVIVKVSENGNLLASKVMGAAGSDRFFAVDRGNNELVIAAKIRDQGFGGSDGALVRVDYNLNLKSLHLIGASAYEELTAIKALSDGSVILHGMTESAGNGFLDLSIIKVSAANQIDFVTLWGDDGDDVSYFGGLDVRMDGGIAVLGQLNETNEKNNGNSVRDGGLLLLDQYGKIGTNTSCAGVLVNQTLGIVADDLALNNISLNTANPSMQLVDVTTAALAHNVQSANQCTAP